MESPSKILQKREKIFRKEDKISGGFHQLSESNWRGLWKNDLLRGRRVLLTKGEVTGVGCNCQTVGGLKTEPWVLEVFEFLCGDEAEIEPRREFLEKRFLIFLPFQENFRLLNLFIDLDCFLNADLGLPT